MTDFAVQDVTAMERSIHLAANGDEAAFSRLVAEHHAAMARVAYVIAGDAEAARDAVQAAWILAWQRLRTLRDPNQVRAWLIAIAANEARGAVRRRRRVTVVDLSAATDRAAGGDPADAIRVIDLVAVLRGLSAGRLAGGDRSRRHHPHPGRARRGADARRTAIRVVPGRAGGPDHARSGRPRGRRGGR